MALISGLQKSCVICLGYMPDGQGKAIFTAECSHSFHFTCIANNVKHGNLLCPICRFKWKDIPFEMLNANVSDQTMPSSPQLDRFYDDEPLVDSTRPPSRAPLNLASVKAYTQHDVVPAQEFVPDFQVLIRVKAPPILFNDRAPIDLVLVLDVSMSMSGEKLMLLKRTACAIIGKLGYEDRLSIVSFSSSADRILPLCRMTSRGRAKAGAAIHSLRVFSGTNIVEGLKMGERVLGECRERNPAATIIMLSDGKDTYSSGLTFPNQFLNHLTRSPVHIFGFGHDHDSSIMHAISYASGGTYSFIESISMVEDAFARCISGLLIVVAQEFHLTVASTSPGVKLGSIHSGSYASAIFGQGLKGVISVGDLCANEDKEFLIYLSVPICPIGVEKTQLLHIACYYKDSSKTAIELRGERAEILRPRILSPLNHIIGVEVDRQRNRLALVESIVEAQRIAKSGNFEGSKGVLSNKRTLLMGSTSTQDGDDFCGCPKLDPSQIES